MKQLTEKALNDLLKANEQLVNFIKSLRDGNSCTCRTGCSHCDCSEFLEKLGEIE